MSSVEHANTLASQGNKEKVLWAILSYAFVNESDCLIDDIREAIEIETGLTHTAVSLGVRMARQQNLVAGTRYGLHLTSLGQGHYMAIESCSPLDDSVSAIYEYPDN